MKVAESKTNTDSGHSSSFIFKGKKENSFFADYSHAPSTFFGPVAIQPKLKIGRPDDKYERESDRIADAVMRIPDPQMQFQPVEEEEEEIQMKEEEPVVQMKCADCEEEEKLQRKQYANGSPAGAHDVSVEISSQLMSSAGKGNRLPEDIQSEMRHKMGEDFSGVSIHTDSNAVQMNRELGAKAFTHGIDIYFNEGQYKPASTGGKHLLAHELVHVVQQGEGHLLSKHIQRSVDEDEITDIPPRYSFSTRCGWIDWGHASPGMTSQLIEAVQDASDNMRASGSTSAQSVTSPAMESSVAWMALSSVTPTFTIKRPLSRAEVLSVALRVFMLQSLAFENLQQWTDFIGESSFSAEDLPSNLIAFYMAAEHYDRNDIETICDVWDPESSLSEFESNPPTERNRTFRPLASSRTTGWPLDLSTISPAVVGGPLMDSPTASIETLAGSARNINLAEYNALLSHHFSVRSVSGSNTINIASEESSSAVGNHFDIAGLPSSHDLVFRWNILDDDDNAYAMWSDSGPVQQYSDANDAYIGSGTRALLRDRNISSVRVNCRIALRNARRFNEVFRLRVHLTW